CGDTASYEALGTVSGSNSVTRRACIDAPEDSVPPRLHEPELPHADGPRPAPSAHDDHGRERVGEIDAVALALLRVPQGEGRGVRLSNGARRCGSQEGLPLRRRAPQPAQAGRILQGPAGDSGVPADRESRAGDAVALLAELPESAGRHRAAPGRARNGALPIEPAPDSEDDEGAGRPAELPNHRSDALAG